MKGWDEKTKVVLESCQLRLKERFESASLGGPARPVFPTGLARPNAASGWEIRPVPKTSRRFDKETNFLVRRISPALRRKSRRLRARLGWVSIGEATAPPVLSGGERRGAPTRPTVVLAEAEATERREAWRNSYWTNEFSPLVLLLSFLMFQVNAYAQGTVKGRVIFEGTPPAAEKVEVKSDIPTCGTTKEIQKIILGSDQGVANAVVKIIGAQGTLETQRGTLDQVHCEFVPHVQVLPVASTLILTSSDPVLHNSHGFYEDGSTAFNIAVPIMGMEVSQKLSQAGIIKLRCDAGHTWMSAYVVVTDAPYYALTDADGNFSMNGVPPGDYEIEIWHEWLGTQSQPVKVGEGEQALVIEVKKNGR